MMVDDIIEVFVHPPHKYDVTATAADAIEHIDKPSSNDSDRQMTPMTEETLPVLLMQSNGVKYWSDRRRAKMMPNV